MDRIPKNATNAKTQEKLYYKKVYKNWHIPISTHLTNRTAAQVQQTGLHGLLFACQDLQFSTTDSMVQGDIQAPGK